MKNEMFSNKDLKNLILPLFVEQFLLMFVGIADTFVVSFSGEADVSGVSLVTSFNTVLIFLFTALSSGGAVIISQYIGKQDKKEASRSASQLLLISILISIALSALILLFKDQLLHLLFGKIEPDVMHACESYLIITTFSLPALAVYDAGAALCRSIEKTNATMYISAVTNLLNIIGNCIGVFVFHLGAAGVAYPSLITRMLSAVAVTAYCFYPKLPVTYRLASLIRWDGSLQKKIMGIALPNGIENGIHQLVKVALSSMVALFGTYQIAANGVAQSIWSLASIMGLAMAPVYTTVIGQCMGARDIDAANDYFKKLNKITLVLSIIWNIFVFAITPLIIRYSAISAEAKSLVIWLVLINNIFNGLAYPFAGSLGNGLRAAGDVKFTMLTSISLTIAARLFFSALFGLVFGWGVIGVALGMSMDLVFRGIIFIHRYHSQKWTQFHLI
ncbi:MATE family efflux transporter [Kineothrix sp. MSJ-39]|uniref:MATE family efflux transporter n=1 Tax=Kineothrix sp. MSJ-39 TaxID=2841533 RepID=UPI001C0FFA13|nr:MATE family efflux transporter [Kineothrix sp. MSJ-39]MBU5429895.1 MATE family efflux transporter [Kineothrix sp. MSJ-39]